LTDFETEEVWRRHADNRDLTVQDGQRSTDRRRVAAKLSYPKCVVEHHRRRAAAHIVGWIEQASERRRHAQRRKRVSAHPQPADDSGIGAGADEDRRRAPREDT
jgi:hypothetical protein